MDIVAKLQAVMQNWVTRRVGNKSGVVGDDGKGCSGDISLLGSQADTTTTRRDLILSCWHHRACFISSLKDSSRDRRDFLVKRLTLNYPIPIPLSLRLHICADLRFNNSKVCTRLREPKPVARDRTPRRRGKDKICQIDLSVRRPAHLMRY